MMAEMEESKTYDVMTDDVTTPVHVPLMERLCQRKTPSSAPVDNLKRCLGLFDLVNSGFSIMVGAGIFVITPIIAATSAGPAVTVSYLVAGVASLVSALVYCELSSRFDGIGSAYQYVYYVLGELFASAVGISMLIESVIGLSCIIRSLSVYLDTLIFNGTIIEFEKNHLAFNNSFLTDYVDLFGLVLLFLCTALNLVGVKQTVLASALCNSVVLVSLIAVVIVGFSQGTIDNWINLTDPYRAGNTGYTPFGWGGVLEAASLAFFSYNGYDAICSLGSEAKNPGRDLPLAIVLSFAGVMTLYLLVCGAVTYVAPYYLLGSEAGMSIAFSSIPFMSLIVSIGAILATTTGSFGAMMVTPRILFSMAQDGIVFKKLTYVASSTQVPVAATIATALIASTGIIMFNTEELVMMNSGGMLICFSLTSMCVIIGRYQPEEPSPDGKIGGEEKKAIITTFIYWFICIMSCGFIKLYGDTWEGIVGGVLCAAVGVILLVYIKVYLTEVTREIVFTCPFSPWLPGLGIYINCTLMVSLPAVTWVRVGVCTLIGFGLYGVYGLRNSLITQQKKSFVKQSVHYTSEEKSIGSEEESRRTSRVSIESDKMKLLDNES